MLQVSQLLGQAESGDLLSEDISQRDGGSGEGVHECRLVESLEEVENDQISDSTICQPRPLVTQTLGLTIADPMADTVPRWVQYYRQKSVKAKTGQG
jgi:hypothetical protein